VRLDDLTSLDLDWIAPALESWSRTHRWSLRGHTSSPALMRTLLYDQVGLQRVVRDDAGVPAAVVQLVAVEPRHGLGQMALLADPRRLADVAEPVAVFVADAFRETGLRKLCVLAHADELDVPTVLGPAGREVGRLVGHERRGPDSYVDLLLYEIWREGA
jgi:hypothetical protein